jgi:hypothetical protein
LNYVAPYAVRSKQAEGGIILSEGSSSVWLSETFGDAPEPSEQTDGARIDDTRQDVMASRASTTEFTTITHLGRVEFQAATRQTQRSTPIDLIDPILRQGGAQLPVPSMASRSAIADKDSASVCTKCGRSFKNESGLRQVLF